MGFQFQFSIPAFRAFRAAATRTERDAEKLRTRARARARAEECIHRARVCEATAVKLRGPIFVAGSVRKEVRHVTSPSVVNPRRGATAWFRRRVFPRPRPLKEE
jgi:hypothetical protein